MAAALRRSRLERTDKPGLLIVAPAGSGKTVLAAQIAARASRAGWARLAPGRAGAGDLVELASAAFGEPAPPDGVGLVELAGHLAGLLDAGGVLVVDDYFEALGDCDALLAEALSLLGADSTIVVCARTRPPGLLGRSGQGLLDMLGPADLAFDRDEAVALFQASGSDPSGAEAAVSQVGGWAAGVAVAAATGYPSSPGALRDLMVSSLGGGALVEALSVLPYLTGQLASALGLGSEADLRRLAERSPLLNDHAGAWSLTAAATALIRPAVDDREASVWRSAAAAAICPEDPATAIDLLVQNGAFQEAIAVARVNLSAISPERALPWLYRIPADLRHQLPPILGGGKATVDLDAATIAAEEAVRLAVDDPARREASFGLGSAHLHAGRLSEAAQALEVACGPGSPPRLAAAASGWLAAVRWWAGDLVGARAAAEAGAGDPVAEWVAGELRLAGGDLEGTTAPALGGPALAAKARLMAGDGAGRVLAADAYRQALAEEGFALAVAGPVEAWHLLLAGDLEAAASVADVVNRRIGRHDAFSSLHVWLIRLAIATAGGNRDGIEEATKRIGRIRQLGFAPVEAQVRSLLPQLAGTSAKGLEVAILGVLRLSVDGRAVDTRWRSAKALEVLCYLAIRGARGAGREEVIEAVWPDREPDKGRMLLRAALAEIRRRLEPGRPTGEPSRFLVSRGDRLQLLAAVDAAQAREAVAAGRPGDALGRFRGDPLEDLAYSEWVIEERGVLSTWRAALAEECARDPLAEVAARIAALELLIAGEPWRGDLFDRLSELHRSAGNEAAVREVQRRRKEAGAY
ncbi:MAG TPA: hypothetical protein VFH70_00145 [Acidimicrobiales bacterium]|nr:hypothetical protein [Acidimicrobiales bacterium]